MNVVKLASVTGLLCKPIRECVKNTAGLYLRFRLNTTPMALTWALYQNRMMNHLTETASKKLYQKIR